MLKHYSVLFVRQAGKKCRIDRMEKRNVSYVRGRGRMPTHDVMAGRKEWKEDKAKT